VDALEASSARTWDWMPKKIIAKAGSHRVLRA